MNDIPILVFCALVLGDGLAEYLAMLRTGTLRWKHKREWTYFAVAVPFKAMLLAAIVEHVALDTRPTTTMMVAGSVIAAAGILVRVRGHLELAGAFSQYVEKSEGQTLVQSGMYARVRHPMYVGNILLAVGIPLAIAATWAWIFSAFMLVGIFLRICKEEAFLAQELPGYRDYMQRTWRLVPYVY